MRNRNLNQFRGVWFLALALLVIESGWAGPPPRLGRGSQSLDALSVALELTPEQARQAGEIIKAGETAKMRWWDKLREKFAQLNELVRSEAPQEAEVRELCQSISFIQGQLVYQDAQTQIAFRKLLDARQLDKLNRLELSEAPSRGPDGNPRPGGRHRPGEKRPPPKVKE